MATEIAAVLAPLAGWFVAVNNTVPAPYLDEVFHVRQAQHYCNGRFDIWDPKITTPPGLYILSYLASPLLGCSITSLRLINAICLIALMLIIRATYQVRKNANHDKDFLSRLVAYHSAFNIVLFPPLFFFSALYYTDIASTLSVMVFYWHFLCNLQNQQTGLASSAIQVLLGAISLTFRQTNIFWVAVAPAALTLVGQLDHGHRVVKESMYRRAAGFGDTIMSVVRTSWKMGVVHDPPVRDAYFEDYLRFVVSVATCLLKTATQPKRLVRITLALAPYLTLITLFVTFILWNGSVVLGDKSNHVATINVPQILYLWPFITFFSWPILLPHLLLIPLMLLARLSRSAGMEPLLLFRRCSFLPRTHLILIFTLLAALVIHFNTVVHPFTLADNRHYNFYIFRRLLRPWWVRYAVTPIYILTAWACIESRGEQPNPTASSAQQIDSLRRSTAAQQAPPPGQSRRPLRLPDGKSTASVSFIVVCLATTALNLCSAPLVEPRYVIIPWIIWRMHLPLYSTSDAHLKKDRSWKAFLEVYDWRVIVESLWFLLINFVTGYIFLNWTFIWPQEPGTLQRFMW